MNIQKWMAGLLLLLVGVFIAMPKAHAAAFNVGRTGAVTSGRSTTVTPGGTGGSSVNVTPPSGASSDFSRLLQGGYVVDRSTAFQGLMTRGRGLVPVAGQVVAAEIGGGVTTAALIGAVTGFVGGGVPGAVIGGGLPLLADWINRTDKFRIGPDGKLEKNLTAPKTTYDFDSVPDQVGRYDTVTLACTAWIGGNATYAFSSAQGLKCLVKNKNIQGADEETWGFVTKYDPPTGVPPPADWKPATMNEAAPAMANIEPQLGVLKEMVDHGIVIGQAEPWVLSGPASVAGPSSTTVAADGTSTATQTTHNYSYGGQTVTNTTNVTTTTTTTPGGVTTTTTTTDTPATGPTSNDVEEPPPTDTPLPPLPSLYERKYPNGMVGIWNEKKEALKNTALVQLASKLMPNVGSGGSCPSWILNMNLADFAAYGTYDVAPPCWVWDFGKAIILVSALLLARRLVFGG